jgi:phenol hydroxylase P1 protein
MRRGIEEALVDSDWATGVVAIDLIDRLLYPLLYRHLDEVALLSGAGAYSLIAQHFAAWFDDNRRWLDELYSVWLADPKHGAANLAQLQSLVDTHLPVAVGAVHAVAGRVADLVGTDADGAVALAASDTREFLTTLGLTLEDKQ